ncbi:MAG: glutamate synthase subunit beta [Frankiaceae bacterium]
MADPTGFLTTARRTAARRPVDVRIRDWREVHEDLPADGVVAQAGRCMDCGVPFCHSAPHGCPLGNLIPEWNELAWRGEWREAIERLHATNNFPELTGRLCPAPCESACVLGLGSDPVAVKQVEVSIVDRAWAEGWVAPVRPARPTGRTVAVVGSGPAGLAAAQQLTRTGHAVVVLERADEIGGLLRYGIPDFKLEKRHLDRRLDQMRAEGTRFRTGVHVGAELDAAELRAGFDAVVLAGGCPVPRELPVPGRALAGIHAAMEYLPLANRAVRQAGGGSPAEPAVTAAGKHVVVIGGGDTGADCIGTAHRQGAASVSQLEILQRPPGARTEAMPWPTCPTIYRTSSAHEEGGERHYGVSTKRFAGDADGRVRALVLVDVVPSGGGFAEVPGTERELPCDLALLAMGFVGTERGGLVEQLGLELDARGNVVRDASWMTSAPGIFVAGDMGRGQSLVVWAIAEGRAAAAAVDRFLMGTTTLPAPIEPTDRPR